MVRNELRAAVHAIAVHVDSGWAPATSQAGPLPGDGWVGPSALDTLASAVEGASFVEDDEVVEDKDEGDEGGEGEEGYEEGSAEGGGDGAASDMAHSTPVRNSAARHSRPHTTYPLRPTAAGGWRVGDARHERWSDRATSESVVAARRASAPRSYARSSPSQSAPVPHAADRRGAWLADEADRKAPVADITCDATPPMVPRPPDKRSPRTESTARVRGRSMFAANVTTAALSSMPDNSVQLRVPAGGQSPQALATQVAMHIGARLDRAGDALGLSTCQSPY